MLRNDRRIGVVTGLLGLSCVLVACDGPARGGAGESCTARADCDDGLACVGLVCTEPSKGGAISGDDGGGAEGAMCRGRRDCKSDLICLDNSCQRPSANPTANVRYSERGESCQAKNDCAPELSCVMGTCRAVSVTVERTPKSCHRVECAERADCCTGFVPNPNCPEYEKNCKDDPVFCNSFHTLCECNRDCVGEMCVAAAPGCASNAECASQQTPFCVEGKCAQCQEDSNCQGAGARCNHGTCVAACTLDENCGALQACQGGICVDTGCTSDRQCVFLMRDALAICSEGQCRVPCLADSDCAAGSNMTNSFQICDQGECVFVGCETDTECRALLGLQSMNTTAHAVCKE